MGEELLNLFEPSPNKSFSETFDELFPHYLAIGMKPEEYWDGDPFLVRAYKKAFILRMGFQNQLLWRQGRYIYDALVEVSPMYAFKPQQAMPYTEEPYPMTAEEAESQQREKDRKRMEERRKYLQDRINKGR